MILLTKATRKECGWLPQGGEEKKTSYAVLRFFRNSRRLRVASTLKTTTMERKRKDGKMVSIMTPFV
jgi:hypothetical protein